MDRTDKPQRARSRSWWKRRVPVRVRHHSRLIGVSIVVLLLTGLLLGSFQVRPIIFSDEMPIPMADATVNIPGTVDFFNLDWTHSLHLQVKEVDLQRMRESFQRSGEKVWVEADATIDGTFLPSVGIRLKGNSTLRQLRPGSRRGFERFFGGNRRGGAHSNATFNNPSTLPLLLSFDRYVRGRVYQGRSELAIRPAREGGATLNEALALQLIKDSGQVSQDFTWVTYGINDAPTATRLVIENPDQNYAQNIALGSGILYKSRSENDFTYRGEDPTRYESDFDQLNAKGTFDLAPVIGLLAWLRGADEETFDAELPQWVDIDSFARYVATQELVDNFDDMAGPGHNFLLWYDLKDRNFTVISWDMNMAFGAGGFLGRGMRSRNSLKDRFVRSDVYAPRIDAAREELRALWTEGNHAFLLLDRFAGAVPDSDLLNEDHIVRDAIQVRRSVQSALR